MTKIHSNSPQKRTTVSQPSAGHDHDHDHDHEYMVPDMVPDMAPDLMSDAAPGG